jgi:hypothetical protein
MNTPRLGYFFVILLLGGCTSLSPIHQNSEANPRNSIQQGKGYQLAFIEFGEQGSYQDTSQLGNATELIKKTSKPLVITYVHGWQNSASSADVDKFSGLLGRLSQAPLIRDQGFDVIGVYLAWRGKLTSVPIVKELSFYNRKAAAERIASNFDCFDAIAAISEAARTYHGSSGQYTILLGHSFGGLIVERAVAHAVNAEMHGHADADRSLPADLILTVNPASDSILSRQMIAALYNRKTENARPFLVSITSSADAATGLAFEAGTSLAATTKAFNEVTAPGPAKLPESERRFYTSTPGHNQLLINHVTEKLSRTIDSKKGLKALEMNLSHNLTGETFTLDGPNQTLELWQIKHIGDVDVPYWDVKVDPSIIKNHGDLWNPRAEAMMAAIFRIANPLMNREAKPRANLQRTPDPNRVKKGHARNANPTAP